MSIKRRKGDSEGDVQVEKPQECTGASYRTSEELLRKL